MAKSVEERVAALKAKKERLNHRLVKLEAVAKSEARKVDTRRKIIVGGLVIAAMENDGALTRRVHELLRNGVTRDHDRAAVAELLAPAPVKP